MDSYLDQCEGIADRIAAERDGDCEELIRTAVDVLELEILRVNHRVWPQDVLYDPIANPGQFDYRFTNLAKALHGLEGRESADKRLKQAAWGRYKAYLMEKYPSEGEWELTCEHHKKIDGILGRDVNNEEVP